MNPNFKRHHKVTELGSGIVFSDLFDMEEVQHLQDLFADAHGVASIITCPDGTPITRPSNFTRLCSEIIRKTDLGCQNCFKSDATIGRYHPEGPIVQKCHSAGLLDAGSSISVGGQYVANWLIGQVRNEGIDEGKMLAYADTIGVNREDFRKALYEVPVMTLEKFEKVSKLLFSFSNQLSEKAFSNLKLKLQIDDKVKTAATLAEHERQFRTMFEANPQPMWIYDLETLAFLLVNDAAISHYGYSREEFLSMSLKDIRPAEDISLLMADVAKTIKTYNKAGEWRHLKKNGELIYVTIVSHTITFNNHKARHVLITDITERKAIEDQLRQSEYQFRQITELTPNGIAISQEGTICYVNPAGVAMLRAISREELIGRTLISFIPTEFLSTANSLIELVNSGYKVSPVETKLIRNDNSTFDAEIAALATSFNDQPAGMIIIRDITDRNKALETSKKLKVAINQSKEIFFITDKEGIIEFINPEFTNVYGYTPEEVLGKVTPRIIKSGFFTSENYENFWKTLLNKGSIKEEYINKCKDGSLINIEGSADPILDHKNEIIGFLGVQRDITNRKQAEAKQQKNEKALLEAQQIAQIGSWEYDIANEKPTWSKQMFELFGLNPDDGEPSWEDHRSIIHPDDWSTVDSAVKTAISDGNPYNMEFRILHPTEGQIWALTVGQPEYDDNGKLIWLKGTTQNINDRRLIEEQLKMAKSKAEESDRLKSAFLANMSHEVRTPLNSIIGFSELLADPDFDEETKSEFIRHIISNGNNLLTIISDIMDISKIEAHEITIRKSKIDICKFITNIKDQFSIQTKEKEIELKLKLPNNIVETILFADADRLRQIINNLMNNALKFTDCGCIEIGYQINGDMIVFYIKDTGIGIHSKYHERIFERFIQVEFGNSRIYGGNGLGLAISKNLVELMGGKIWLESDEGKGSTFYFSLPM